MRLIIQFRLYALLIVSKLYINRARIYIFLYIVFVLHIHISYVIQPFLILFTIPHRFKYNSILFYTRYIFTLPRVFYIYISFHLLNVHTFVLYSYFDIFPRIVINIFPRISYIRIVFYSFPIFIIIFFYSLFLFSSFFFLLIYILFSTYIYNIYCIFNPPPPLFCVKYYSNLLEYPRIGNITIIVE